MMKMVDLRVEVPLADANEFSDVQIGGTGSSGYYVPIDKLNNNPIETILEELRQPDPRISPETGQHTALDNQSCDRPLDNRNNKLRNVSTASHAVTSGVTGGGCTGEDFGESDDITGLSGSLEDLVNSFDERISKCFKNYSESTEKFAPVQVRTQEEIMNECQIWWTLTGNFGNILPIDWSKSYSRRVQLPTLNINQKLDNDTSGSGMPNEDDVSLYDRQRRAERRSRADSSDLELDESPRHRADSMSLDLDASDDEELAQALDMHSLILTQHDLPPAQTADQVIQEIDEIMQESLTSEITGTSDCTMDSSAGGDGVCISPGKAAPFSLISIADPEIEAKVREAASITSNEEKLQSLSYSKLQTLHSELESLIQVYSESLVSELAGRDELEYEKELKNTFISLLLNVQNKRRQYVTDRKRRSLSTNKIAAAVGAAVQGATSPPTGSLPQYLTAVIPYDDERGPPDFSQLQALIKILKAVNEDSQQVPSLLTDYILNVLCPNSSPQPPHLLS